LNRRQILKFEKNSDPGQD